MAASTPGGRGRVGEDGGDLRVEAAGEDGAEDGHAEGGADGAEEGGAGGGDAQVLVGDGVLHDEDEDLDDQAEADAEGEEVEAHLQVAGVLPQPVQQEQPGGRDAGARDGEDLPVARAGDELAGDGRGDEDPRDHRQHVDAGEGGGDAAHDLEEGRQVGHRAEHGETDDEADHRRQGEGVDAEEPQRQHRFGGPALHPDEPGAEEDGEHRQTDDLRGAPRPGGAAERRGEHEAGGDGGDQEGPQVVDDVPGRSGRDVQGGGDDHEGDRAERHVDVEDPAPAEVLGEDAAEQRSEDAGGAEDGAEQPLVAAALAGWHEVADDRHGEHHQPAAAQSLQGAETDELRHVLGDAAEHRAYQEDRDGQLEQLLPPVLVAEFAPERGGRRGGEEVGGHHPGEVVEPAEVADDGRQGGGDDGLVEGGQQHAQQQGPDGDQDAGR